MKILKAILILLIIGLSIIILSCKKQATPQPVLYSPNYPHQLIITGTETLNAGQPDEENIIFILNNTGADINLKDYIIKEKSNSWTIAGDSIIIKTTQQYSQKCPAINQSYDELRLYNSQNILIQTYNQ